MRKLLFVIGAAVGYILGARAGRERYEQISQQAGKVWNNPKVQSTVEDVKAQAQSTVEDVKAHAPKAAASLADTAKDVAGQAKAKASGKETTDLSGDYENETGVWDGETGTPLVDDSGFGPGGDKLP